MNADCVFCDLVGGESTPEVLAHRGARTAVFPPLKQCPQNRGHMLVVPVSHLPQIYDLDPTLGQALIMTVAAVARATKAVWACDGVAIKQHNEPAGGQDVFHVHFHVVPCYVGDGFFRGELRFPRGSEPVPLEERIEQARRLGAELRADPLFSDSA